VTRRNFILSLAASLLYTFGRFAAATVDSPTRHISEAERLRHVVKALFADPNAARQVGAEYLARFPDVACGALERISLAVAGRTPASLRSWLNRQRQTDFAGGRSVIVDGWVLARCEADICAVLAHPPREQAADVAGFPFPRSQGN